ncbi:MAG: PAS domain-containing protein [Herbaspirillum sp.]
MVTRSSHITRLYFCAAPQQTSTFSKEKIMIMRLEQLIHFAENAAEAWCAKDTDSRFLYTNQVYREFQDLPHDFEIEGLRVGELPAPAAEFAKEFEASDRLVEVTKDVKHSLEIYPRGKDQLLSAYYFIKYPLFDDHAEIIGTIGHAYPALDLQFNRDGVKWQALVFDVPNDTLSKEEWDFVYFAARGHSIEEIARLSASSPDAISRRQDAVFSKLGVSTPEQLEQMVYEEGWHRYIPANQLRGRYPELS